MGKWEGKMSYLWKTASRWNRRLDNPHGVILVQWEVGMDTCQTFL
jgi:hypothetical protein